MSSRLDISCFARLFLLAGEDYEHLEGTSSNQYLVTGT